MLRPPLTLSRLFEVIFSHVSPVQRLAILEDLEALEAEISEPPVSPPAKQLLRPAPNCVIDHP
jgi:hypothetical protein